MLDTVPAPEVSLAGRTEAVETVVGKAFDSELAAAFPEGLTVLAVGGFGRRELFPASDVDLLLLVAEEPAAGPKRDAIGAFQRALWDSRLRVGQSVHTIESCCQLHPGNLELTFSLLDRRRLCGDQNLYGQLEARMGRFLQSTRHELAGHLRRMTESRHAKFDGTIYHLEPNVKESPGALRDVHVVHWLRQLGFAQEPEQLADATAFLASIRTFLHSRSGRDQNVLSFDAQEEIAGDPAAWMREYYRHARNVYRACLQGLESVARKQSSLTAQFRDWRSRLSNSEFSVVSDRILLKNPHQFESDPGSVWRLAEFAGRHGVPAGAETERRLGRVAAAPLQWPTLRNLLQLPHAVLALRTLIEGRVFRQVLPEWDDVECLVVRDFYHRYTVDEHTLVAMSQIEKLRSSEDVQRARFRELLSEIEDVAPLLLALLLHDLGKGARTGNHSEESVKIAESVFDRLGVPQRERDVVRFLIARHLDLSALMTSRDLDDPGTGRALAAVMGTVENLKLLTLLTYCDISAVNPTAMTPWRLDQLWRVYRVGHQALTRSLQSDRIADAAQFPVELQSFLTGLPKRYLLTHSSFQIRSHAEMARIAESSGVATKIHRQEGCFLAEVVTNDRPGLLADLAGALASFGLNILKAEAFSNADGVVIDTFTFADPHRTLELNPSEVDRLRRTLDRVAIGQQSVRTLLASRRAPAPARKRRVQTTVAVDVEASDAATLFEVFTEDRPGLLYDLTRTISAAGCDIALVLIDTEAHKALDVFYVTANGEKLDSEASGRLREQLLAACS